jgi:hypothetical protein
LAASLQFSHQIDERWMSPWFSDAARLLKGNNVGCRLLDNTEAVKFQLADYRRLPGARKPRSV